MRGDPDIFDGKAALELRVKAVAGAANNPLVAGDTDAVLARRGILYAPDYVANAGGVINVYSEVVGWDAARSLKKADEIYDTVLGVFEIAKAMKIPSYEAADRLAERRLESSPPLTLPHTPSVLRPTPYASKSVDGEPVEPSTASSRT